MQVIIYDQQGAKTLQYFAPGAVGDIAYSIESPYGMMDASFELPIEFSSVQPWANHFNQVDIYDGSELVWQGFIYGIGRKFTDKGVSLAVDCVGWVAKLGMLTTATNLVNERGSTYITAHVLGDSELSKWVSAGTVATTDYAILATRDYQPYKTFREIMDDINTFNGWDWQVRGKYLYYHAYPSTVDYVTHARYVRGAVTQDLGDFANTVKYSYKNTSGVITKGSTSDSATVSPVTHKVVALPDGITSAEATQQAGLYLAECKTMRSSSGVTVAKVWTPEGRNVPLTQVLPGRVIRIEGVAVNPATLSTAFAENDTDVFRISQVRYTNERKEVTLSPGKVASKLPVILARLGLRK